MNEASPIYETKKSKRLAVTNRMDQPQYRFLLVPDSKVSGSPRQLWMGGRHERFSALRVFLDTKLTLSSAIHPNRDIALWEEAKVDPLGDSKS